MTHWFTQSWIWCWGTARATNNVGTSENTRCHRKCELLNLWWKVSLAHVWGREHTEVYLEILFGDVKWDNEIWEVHKTVCILDRFLSPMRSSPAISLSLTHTHTHRHTHIHHTLSVNLSLMWSNTQGGEFWARDICGVFIWFLEEQAPFGKACQWKASGVWGPLLRTDHAQCCPVTAGAGCRAVLPFGD